MVAFTNRRAGREVAIIVAEQTAKGTPKYVTTSDDIIRCHRASVHQGPMILDPTPAFMTEDYGPPSAARVRTTAEGEGEFSFMPTNRTLKRVMAGGFSNAGLSTQAVSSTVDTWMSILWVESRFSPVGPNYKYLLPYTDCFIDRLQFNIEHNGRVECTAHFLYETRLDPVELDGSPGSWTLPSSPMEQTSALPYNGREVLFRRDPDGTAVDVNFNSLEVVLNHKAKARPFMSNSNRWTVWKGGKMEATILLRVEADDVAWAELTNSQAGTFLDYDVRLINESPTAPNFYFRFHDVDWLFGPYVNNGIVLEPFEALGRAHVNASGDYVTYPSI